MNQKDTNLILCYADSLSIRTPYLYDDEILTCLFYHARWAKSGAKMHVGHVAAMQ